jgi:hypothetical protein
LAETRKNGAETRWLLLIHQIPPKPNYLRVKIGRRLQRLGAVPIKNSVYVLPRSDQAYEDFQWVSREIAEGGGEASVCEARFIDGLSDDQVEGLFNTAREANYTEVAEEARRLSASLKRRKKIDDELTAQAESAVARLRKRLADIFTLDFFGANGGQAAEGLVSAIEQQLHDSMVHDVSSPSEPVVPAEELRGRTWVTRKGIHVDRMASAWLIGRFVDTAARFKFVVGKGYQPEPGEIRFDMFDAEYTHEGERCTFEVLVRRLALEDPALRPVAEIVHDIDLKDEKFARPEVLGIDRLIAGICMAARDDESRLSQGRAVFDALYEYFKKKRSERRLDD